MKTVFSIDLHYERLVGDMGGRHMERMGPLAGLQRHPWQARWRAAVGRLSRGTQCRAHLAWRAAHRPLATHRHAKATKMGHWEGLFIHLYLTPQKSMFTLNFEITGSIHLSR